MLDTHEKAAALLPTVFGVPSYTFFVLLGILMGLIYYLLTAKRSKTPSEGAIIIVVAALLFGMVGAKIPLILEGASFEAVLRGKSIIGGLIGGLFGVVFIKKLFRIKLRLGNIIAPSVALGMAVGRIGCFFNGCCYGKPASWGVDFGDGILRLPTQLFEVVFHFTAFLFLAYFKEKVPKNGILFKLYLLTYFIFRFIIEFVRENPIVWMQMTVYQWICIAGAVFVLIGIWKRRKN